MATKQTFTFRGTAEEVTTRIRWCRENLGLRGQDWDFVGGFKKVHITINDGKMLTFYTLKFGNRDGRY